MELASATINQYGKRPSQLCNCGHWIFVRFDSFISFTWEEIVFGIAYLKEENVASESIAAVNKELDLTLLNVVIFTCWSKRKWSYMQ